MSEYRMVKSLLKSSTKRATVKQARTTNYGQNWEQVSATCLRLANYVCQDCGRRANRAHHIIPLSKGGSNMQLNLKAICTTCHSKYHRHLQ